MANNTAIDDLRIMQTVTGGVLRIDNFDELKTQLSAYMDAYRGVQFTEDSENDARKVVAMLRKAKAQVETVRKAAEKEYMVPLNEFKAKVKELTGLIDEPINLINAQINEFDAIKKEERQARIDRLYKEVVLTSDYAEYLPLKRFFDPKWLLASANETMIRRAMQIAVDGAQMEVESIKAMIPDPEAQELALKTYKGGASILAATTKAREYLDMVKAAEERKQREAEDRARRAEEEARQREEARLKEEAEKAAAFETPMIEPLPEPAGFEAWTAPEAFAQEPLPFSLDPEPEEEPETARTVHIDVTGTDEELELLRGYLANNVMSFIWREGYNA